MENDLICNILKCRKKITSNAWITSCSHVFCNEDGTNEFSNSHRCPTCNSSLPDKYDIVRVDLNPSEQYKSMALAGHRPEVILDVCTRAIALWAFQVNQEIRFQSHLSTKAKDRQIQLQEYYEQVITKTQADIKSAKNQIASLKKELESEKMRSTELSEKLVERSRQYQRLQSLYDAQKRKCVSPSNFNNYEMPPNVPFGIALAADIFKEQYDKANPFKEFTENQRPSAADTDFAFCPGYTPSRGQRNIRTANNNTTLHSGRHTKL